MALMNDDELCCVLFFERLSMYWWCWLGESVLERNLFELSTVG